jgi:hypothetical protein
MKTAHGVQLVRKERKSSDPADLLYDVFIRRVQFYRGDNDFVKEQRLFRPMTEQTAKQLAVQLQIGQPENVEVSVFESVVDDEQYLAESLDDLRPKNESLSIKDLRQTALNVLGNGMNSMKIVREELAGAERLRNAVRECLKEKISHERILKAVAEVIDENNIKAKADFRA